jgi:hypothetical protein
MNFFAGSSELCAVKTADSPAANDRDLHGRAR